MAVAVLEDADSGSSVAAVAGSRWAPPLMVDGKEMTPRQRSTRLIGMGGILPPLGFYLCAGCFGLTRTSYASNTIDKLGSIPWQMDVKRQQLSAT